VNDDGGAAVGEDGIFVGAESDIGSDSGGVSCAIRGDNESEVGDVTRGHAHGFVGVAASEMRTGGFEIGRLALGNLMDVDGMFTRRKIFDVECDFDAFRGGRKNGGADRLTLDVLDVHSDGLGVRMSLLSENGAGST